MYEVHKFGGASIGSFERIKNTIEIIKSFRSDSKIIIFSAMGKVTNMLEEIIISSYKNNEKINLIDFFKEYPNKNIALDLNALKKALKKIESLKDLIDFYSNSPFQKLKDGRSSI